MICRQVSRKQIWSSHRQGLCRWLYSSTTAQPSSEINGCANSHPSHQFSRGLTWKYDGIFSKSKLSSLLDKNNLNPFKGSFCVQKNYFSTNALADIPVTGIIDVPLAQTGEGIAECELLKWFVEEGDQVEEFQPLCEVQSDKATIEITSRYKGKVSHILHLPGNLIKVGETLLKLVVDDFVVTEPAVDSVGGLKLLDSDGLDIDCRNDVPKQSNRHGVLATPAVRNLAKQHGIDINDVFGSGNDGRVLKEDVLSYAANKGTAFGTSSHTIDASTTADSTAYGGEYTDTTIPLRGYQRAMVKSMTLAAKIPHFHYVEEINCDELVELKSSFQSSNSDAEVKFTFLPILIKSLSMALTKYPWLNSCFHEEHNEVVLKGSHNIGVAMATPNGLVVPNLKRVQSLSILEITKELSRLQQLAVTNKLTPVDLAGGTITLSNIGAIGGKFGSPLVNSPEVCIIAIGRIQKVPHFDEGGIVYPQSVMTVNIGADHRVLDGATVARFCNEWKIYIEKPELLMLHMR